MTSALVTEQPSTSPVAQEAPVLAFDEYELDIPSFELRRDGEVVPLEPQVFEVLAYLVRNAGRVVPKDELLDAIWPERYVTDGVLNSRVMSARKAVGDSGQEQRYIKTIHGRGYRFVGTTRPVSSAGPDVAGHFPPSPPIPFPTTKRPAPSAPTTSFVGRSDELERLAELLANPECRLISVVGPGGVGKTRLAIEASNRAAETGRDVVFVPLESATDPREIPAAVAAALGIGLRSEEPARELCAYLHTRRELIVLDNVQQLLEGVPFLSELLVAAPGVTLLVTSRSVLGLAGEWVLRVSGLSASEDEHSEAVRLFIQRAGQADAWASSLEASQLEQIAAICRLVDGLPLAIELAASLTRYLPVQQILAQIQQDASVLSSDLRDVPTRHRSIPGLMEGSCRQLPPDELRALESLAVFEGPCSADAAARVGGASLPLVRRLVDHSLVQATEAGFSLHPLMRQFLADRLGDRLTGLRAAHAEYYAQFVADSVPGLEGDEQLAATQRIDSRLPNIAAAWRWAAENDRLDLLARMAYPLFLALTFRGRYYDSHELALPAIETAQRAGEDGQELLAMLLTHRVWVLFRFGRGAEALRDIQQALSIQSAHGFVPPPGFGTDPRLALTVLHHGAGEYGKAYDTAMAVLEEALERGDRTAVAFASWIGGSARLRQANLVWERRPDGGYGYAPQDGSPEGPVEEASRLARAARALLLEMGDSWFRAYVEIELGLISAAKGDLERSCQHYRDAYALRAAFNDPQGMASSQVYLAGSLMDLGRLDEADRLHEDIATLAASIGDSNNLAEVARSMTACAFRRGDLALAFQHARLAADRSIAIGFINNVAGVLGGLGHISAAIREPVLAAQCFAAIAGNTASTPFARARAEAALDELAKVLSSRAIVDIRRAARAVTLIDATRSAIATLEHMEDRLVAASRIP